MSAPPFADAICAPKGTNSSTDTQLVLLSAASQREDRGNPMQGMPAPDRNLLASFPEGYRHLAYMQARIGYKVKTDMPGLDGPEVDALYARRAAWLKGEPIRAET
jgi:hypothetical protein